MQQSFLNISSESWNVIFLVVRYVLVALILAYITDVYVKRKAIHTDIKGRVLEWRVSKYKEIHRWVMNTQSVVAAPSQDEEHFRSIIALTKFKVGYQGMEYASLFDSPDGLIRFAKDYHEMFDRDKMIIDYPLRHTLDAFDYWLDDVVTYYGTFVRTEYDKRWKSDDKTIENHCELACKVLGIALQKDVNRLYRRIDSMMRDRLRNLKISGVYTESLWIKAKQRVTRYCENIMDKSEDEGTRYERLVKWFYFHVLYRDYGCSQLLKNRQDLLTLFMCIHFEDLFAENSFPMDEGKEFYDCYIRNLER